jgi:hypothetical protein
LSILPWSLVIVSICRPANREKLRRQQQIASFAWECSVSPCGTIDIAPAHPSRQMLDDAILKRLLKGQRWLEKESYTDMLNSDTTGIRHQLHIELQAGRREAKL